MIFESQADLVHSRFDEPRVTQRCKLVKLEFERFIQVYRSTTVNADTVAAIQATD